jgi:hypothetical protein
MSFAFNPTIISAIIGFLAPVIKLLLPSTSRILLYQSGYR